MSGGERLMQHGLFPASNCPEREEEAKKEEQQEEEEEGEKGEEEMRGGRRRKKEEGGKEEEGAEGAQPLDSVRRCGTCFSQ